MTVKKQLSGGKIAFSTNGTKAISYSWTKKLKKEKKETENKTQREVSNCYLASQFVQKLTQKNCVIKCKTIKFLEKNEELQNMGLGKNS